MGIFEKKADKDRQNFIDRCIEFDTPRLENETYPDGVSILSDIVYDNMTGKSGLLDIYFPGQIQDRFDEIFFLIHGGAFVYGDKLLDKNYGMHLALKSGIPVANVNYTLMPDTDLAGQAAELVRALEFLNKEYSVSRIHTTGDSAGAYLALLSALLCNDPVIREELNITTDPEIRCLSANLICGGYAHDSKLFPGIYMGKDLPWHYFDLTKAMTKSFARTGNIPVSNITGDKDTMLRECNYFKRACDKAGIANSYYKAVSADDRVMHHVFPIAHPEWPESVTVIDMFVKNSGH